MLSGPGGGDWTTACTAQEPVGAIPDVVLRVPMEEFCLRFADRLAVDAVPYEIDGDADLGRALLDAAPAFAGPLERAPPRLFLCGCDLRPSNARELSGH